MTFFRVPVRATHDHPGYELVNPEHVHYIGQSEKEQDVVCIDFGRKEPGVPQRMQVWTHASLDELLARMGPFVRVDLTPLVSGSPWKVLFLRPAAIVQVAPYAGTTRGRVTMRDGYIIDVADIAAFDAREIASARGARS